MLITMEELKILIQQRKLRYISQEKLADYLGITLTTLSRYENGKREIPFNLVVKYADYVGFELKFTLKT